MILGGLVYTFAFDGFNVQTVTNSEVEAWLAAAGDGSSGGSGGGGTENTPPESPTPENPEDDEEEDDEEDEFDWFNIDFKDTKNWPTPPSTGEYGVSGDFTEGVASKRKYGERRGEKSLYDSNGGEWRPQPLNEYHDTPHWNYKPYLLDSQGQNVGKWMNIDLSGEEIEED